MLVVDGGTNSKLLAPPHPPSANSCSYSPLLEYHQHQPFDTKGITVTVIKKSSNVCEQNHSPPRKLSQQGERMSTITLQWWLHYLPVSHCISPPSQLCLPLWTCASLWWAKIFWGLVLWFEDPSPKISSRLWQKFIRNVQESSAKLHLWCIINRNLSKTLSISSKSEDLHFRSVHHFGVRGEHHSGL